MLTYENSTAAATLAAEVRFVEEGHRVHLDTAAHAFTVVSDSRPGVKYEITVGARGTEMVFTCSCPAGHHAKGNRPLPCKHASGVARRLERAGLAAFDGRRWVVAGPLAA